MSDRLKLSQQICFPFYAISKKITKIYTPLLQELNLTYPQYLVMLILWEKDDILIKDICEKLFLETNTISPILTKLESKNLILKSKKNGNNKDTYITLSKEAKELKKEAQKIPEKLLKKYNFSNTDIQNLHSTLWSFLWDLEAKK